MLPVLAWLATIWPTGLRRPPSVAAAPAPTWPRSRPTLRQLARPDAVLPQPLWPTMPWPASTSTCSARSTGSTSPNGPDGRSTVPGPVPPRRRVPPTWRPTWSSSTRAYARWATCAATWSSTPPWSGSLGFPLVPDPTAPHGFDARAPCPPAANSAACRDVDNAAAQFLLDGTVQLLRRGAARRRQLRRCRRARHQAHPGLGQGEQPQAVRRRPLRQDQTAQGRPRLQAGLQETPQQGRGQWRCAAGHPGRRGHPGQPDHRRRVPLGLRLRRHRHQSPRTGVSSCSPS